MCLGGVFSLYDLEKAAYKDDHLVAHSKLHNVSGHQVGGRDVGDQLSVANAFSLARLELLQRLERVLRVVLLTSKQLDKRKYICIYREREKER